MCLASSLHTINTLGPVPGPLLHYVRWCQGSSRILAELWMNTVTADLSVSQVDVSPLGASLGNLCPGIRLLFTSLRRLASSEC